jgi:DNA primase
VIAPKTNAAGAISCPYLTARSITPETAAHFRVGFFAGRGSMAGRVVIPIHNQAGELVAYAGRAIDDTEPKYKFPAGFHKIELWNLHRVLALEPSRVRRVIVVEGFFDAMRIHQAGFPHVVALMGSSMSREQEDRLAAHFKGVILALDGDEAGKRATDDIALRLARRVYIRIAPVPDGAQPDDLSDDDLGTIFGSL